MTTAAPALARSAARFQALSDPTRLAVLERLRGGERCVCDLTDLLDAAQSRLSFHLRVLLDAGLVRRRREGRWHYYALVPDALEELTGTLASFRVEMSEPETCCGAECCE